MFKMNVNTNFKYKPFTAGTEHENEEIPKDVLERWCERGLATIETKKTKPVNKGKGKKNDNESF